MKSWFENLRAIGNVTKFKEFITGKWVTLPNGRQIFIKVQNSRRMHLRAGLRFSKFAYITDVLSDDGNTATGYGASDFKLLAFEKSIAEAVERIIFRILKNDGSGTKTTSGWACHISEARASMAAFIELVERDAILVHWLKEIPMLEVSTVTFPKKIKNWMTTELSQHPNLKHLRILITNQGVLPTAITLLQTDLGKSVISHATAKDFSEAVRQALIETCRLASNLDEHHFYESSKNLVTNDSYEDVVPQDHGLLYAYHVNLPGWLFGKKLEWNRAKANWTASWKIGMKKQGHFKFHKIIQNPLVVGFGESSDLQNLYFGSTAKAVERGELNLSRLNLERGSDLINLLPHFIA
jgi:hypothetical protein